jgi:protein-S-isoprenylcysteine O-methyltransferase Ste14
MAEATFYHALLIGWFILAAFVFILLLFVPAPYGRHVRSGWGPMVPDRWGWIVMEAPSALVFSACFIVGEHRDTITAWVFLGAWLFHYIYRAFIYPLRRHTTDRRMPLSVVLMAIAFNCVNGYLNGRYLFTYSGGYPNSWLMAPPFLLGAALFAGGLIVNRRSDRTLHDLRAANGAGYEIPQGGFYRWVSSPNYLGEIVEWTGWAIATWSLAGLSFALWTAANLAPRARSNHDWYRQQFPDYPGERKALIPGLW